MRHAGSVAVAAVTAAVSAAALAACGWESGSETSSAAARARARPAPLISTAGPFDDRSVGPGLEALDPIRDGNLVVVPIAALAPAAPARVVTLDDAMSRGLVTVHEVPGEAVQLLSVANRADRPLLIMGGELVFGGHQDRAFSSTVVLAAHDRDDLDVRCVEHDRWEGATRRFVSGRALVHPALRHLLHVATQTAVWEEVQAYRSRRHVRSRTDTYRAAAALQRDPAVQDRRDRILDALRGAPGAERVVGVAAFLGGEVSAIDVFADPSLFAALGPKVVASYVAGAQDGPVEVLTPRPEQIRAALASPTVATELITSVVPVQPGAP